MNREIFLQAVDAMLKHGTPLVCGSPIPVSLGRQSISGEPVILLSEALIAESDAAIEAMTREMPAWVPDPQRCQYIFRLDTLLGQLEESARNAQGNERPRAIEAPASPLELEAPTVVEVPR